MIDGEETITLVPNAPAEPERTMSVNRVTLVSVGYQIAFLSIGVATSVFALAENQSTREAFNLGNEQLQTYIAMAVAAAVLAALDAGLWTKKNATFEAENIKDKVRGRAVPLDPWR